MLAVAAELDLVTRLLAVIAAVLAVRSLRLDGAITGWVSALSRSRHVDPPLSESTPLMAGAQDAEGWLDELGDYATLSTRWRQ